jgi:hypothetical protein
MFTAWQTVFHQECTNLSPLPSIPSPVVPVNNAWISAPIVGSIAVVGMVVLFFFYRYQNRKQGARLMLNQALLRRQQTVPTVATDTTTTVARNATRITEPQLLSPTSAGRTATITPPIAPIVIQMTPLSANAARPIVTSPQPLDAMTPVFSTQSPPIPIPFRLPQSPYLSADNSAAIVPLPVDQNQSSQWNDLLDQIRSPPHPLLEDQPAPLAPPPQYPNDVIIDTSTHNRPTDDVTFHF